MFYLTIQKSFFTYLSDTLWYFYGVQATVVECPTFNNLNAIWNYKMSQSVAKTKCILFNRFN